MCQYSGIGYGKISQIDSWIHSLVEPSKIVCKLSISKVYMRDILSQESIRDQLGSIKQAQNLIFIQFNHVNSSCQSAIMLIVSNQYIRTLIFYPSTNQVKMCTLRQHEIKLGLYVRNLKISNRSTQSCIDFLLFQSIYASVSKSLLARFYRTNSYIILRQINQNGRTLTTDSPGVYFFQ
ncbi:Hypothetical_protein [Hexamita inflata]|uniref:Hypothetical_protein n=1 Tax=Hexamita inflata TaxID=28002 RepID=A0AA86Q799_9EUKA|nr:Hypothetical protein HINF_LOCUS28312 [Hexamita inflata]CAI9951996.1 Hypothetical protein HINF_LOCUS39641 [Hexamita inflata]